MLVRVSPDYYGTFGAKIGCSIKALTRNDPPFEIEDTLADEHIRNGVLIVATADGAPSLAGSSPEAGHRAVTERKAEKGDDWKARAKALGINTFGKKKAEVMKLIEEAEKGGADDEAEDIGAEIIDDGEQLPDFGAMEPQ